MAAGRGAQVSRLADYYDWQEAEQTRMERAYAEFKADLIALILQLQLDPAPQVRASSEAGD